MMRLNQFIAQATGLSRRKADDVIAAGQVTVNKERAKLGQRITTDDVITLDGAVIAAPPQTQTFILNKPVGYICSRDGQGGKTIYDLLPKELYRLKPVGRLDKDSSGLLLFTDDGELANKLTHPSNQKEKVYKAELSRALSEDDQKQIQIGVKLEDGLSRLKLNGNDRIWTITMSEGRNRQIRRTFGALGYRIIKLHRTQFGDYQLGQLEMGKYQSV